MKKIISLLLTLLICCSCMFACTTIDDVEEPKKDEGVNYSTTDYLVKDGKTDYTIVSPNDADETVSFAVSEMTDFFSAATGAKISAEEDSVYSYTSESKIISIGKTQFFEQSNIKLDEEKLQTSGFVVETKGNNIYIAGEGSMGTLCGVYHVLEELFGFTVYASDEIYYEKKSTIPLPLFDVEFEPTIDIRMAHNQMLNVNLTLCKRLKMVTQVSQFIQINGQCMETPLHLVPPATYLEGHKASDYPNNWYIDEVGTDICFSNPELWDMLVEQSKPYISANPDQTRLFLGQKDNQYWCSCERCQAIIAQYGANVSTAILCCNYVEEKLNQWLKEIGDERTLMVGTFSYQYTEEPPATYDEATDTWTANLRTNDNVFVMWAPIKTNRSLPLTDEANKAYAEECRAWSVCTDNLYAWLYSTSFAYFLIDFPNWDATYSNFEFLAQNGVKALYDQGQTGYTHENSTCWIDLKNFLQAELSYDCTQNMGDLINDWFDNYFKDARDAMYKYFDACRNLVRYNIEYKDYQAQGTGALQAKFWPRQSLMTWTGYINEAYEAIEDLKTEDPAMYEKLYNRINKEYLMIEYLLIQLYPSTFSSAELLSMKLHFKESATLYGINLTGEGTGKTFAELYQSWGIA